MSISFEKKPLETDEERNSRVTSQFLRTVRASGSAKAREARNWRFYSGVDFGQWDAAAVRILQDEQRPVHTFNFIQQIVDTIAGQLVQNPFDTVFQGRTQEVQESFNMAQELYDFCRERGNWDYEDLLFITSGLVFRGWGEMFVDYSTSPLGDVSWRCRNPQTIFPDTRWTTSRVKDLRFLMDPVWMTAEDIAEHYATKDEDVMQALREIRDYGGGDMCKDAFRDVLTEAEEFYNPSTGEYRVINVLYMVTKRVTDIVDSTNGKTLPGTVGAFAHNMDPQTYKAVVDIQRECRVLTIVPGLSSKLVLADGPHPLQVGHIPYITFQSKDLWGQTQGLVDLLADAQEVYNKRESTVSHILSTTANGAVIVDKRLVPDKKECDRMAEGINKPNEVFFGESDGTRSLKDAVVPLSGATIDANVVSSMDRAQQFLNNMLPQPMAGQGQGANEANSKFVSTLQQALVRFEPLNQSLQYAWNVRAEDWLPAAKQTYSGPKRRMWNVSKGKEFQVNRPVVSPTPGSLVAPDPRTGLAIENPIEMLDRYDVMIVQSPKGATMRDEVTRQIMGQLQFTQNPIMRSRLEAAAVDYIKGIPDQLRTSLKKDADLWANFQQQQIQTQYQALQQPPAPPAGPPGMADPMTAKDAATMPGMGPIPDNAGIAGGSQGASNNASPPSEMGARSMR